MPVLDKPMSELTKHSTIVIADIEAYVNRSSEVRRQEVEEGKNPGRVKRPMNAFMLYRKAYQQRAKEWASQHNHQIVSRVCGMSWPLEPEQIRQQYKSWADLERDNHQKAHPNYKFTPSKPQKPAPKYERGFDDRSDGSELGDYDWVDGAGSRMRSATHTPGADSDYMPSRSGYAATHPHPPPHPHPHQLAGMQAMGMLHHTRSTALDFNPGKPLPGVYDNHGLPGPYYEAQMRTPQQRHLHHGGIEGGLARRTPSPSLAFQQPSAGLHSHYDPNQYHHPKVEQQLQPQPQAALHHQHQQSQHHQPQYQQHHHAQHFEHRIDPSLMAQDDALFDAGSFNSIPSMFESGLGSTQQTWQPTQLTGATEAESQFSHAFMSGLDETLSIEHAQYLKGTEEEWQIEQLPESAHFDTSWVEPKVEP
jgi:hypothetical protein